MSLFNALVKKPLRFVASTLFGGKGRKVVDEYSPLIEECISVVLPELRAVDDDMGILANVDFKSSVENWAKKQGVPGNLLGAFAEAVLTKGAKQ